MNQIIIPAARRLNIDNKTYLAYELPLFVRDYYWYFVKQNEKKGIHFEQLKISKPFKPRSTGWKSQNHHFNGHLQQLAACTGHSFGVMKIYIENESISAGWPIETGLDGVAYPKSEADVSSTEINAGIETCHRIAAELNCYLVEE